MILAEHGLGGDAGSPGDRLDRRCDLSGGDEELRPLDRHIAQIGFGDGPPLSYQEFELRHVVRARPSAGEPASLAKCASISRRSCPHLIVSEAQSEMRLRGP